MAPETENPPTPQPALLAPTKAVGWKAVLQSQFALPTREQEDNATPTGSRPASGSSTIVEPKTAPNEAIFNTQFTTAGRKFLSKVKKNRAMQVDRRTKGFQLGLEHKTVIIDPITKRHYRVLIVDPDLQRREDLGDGLEHYFEVLVAATNERAFILLGMFKVDLVLLHVALGNDHSVATSSALEFLRDIKRKHVHIPVSLMVQDANVASKLLAQALSSGGCGFFEDSLPIEQLIQRISKLLHSFVLAQRELVICRGSKAASKDIDDDEDFGTRSVQAMIKRGTMTNLAKRPATSKPASVKYDQQKMLMELSLKQRKQCVERQKQLTEALGSSHSVLGIGHDPDNGGDSLHLPTSSPLHHSVSAPTVGLTARVHAVSIGKKIPPLPSAAEISKQIYTKPQEIQVRIHQHLYASYHTAKHDALPQDPLLRPCVAVNPESMSRSASNLLIGKAYRLYLEKRYEEALQQCNRAIRVQDNNLIKLAYLLRGVLLDLSGHYQKAEREFLAALKLDPDLHQAHFNLGVSRLKMGNDQQALQDITTALHLDPANEDYLRNRALIYRRLGEFGLAQHEYGKIETLASPGAAVNNSNHALSVPRLSPMARTSSLTSLLQQSTAPLDVLGMEDGVFAHLFGQPTPDKLALITSPADRDSEQLGSIVSRLQTVPFFLDFPRSLLHLVAETLEYEVVACGKSFTIGEEHPHNFYVLLSGRLSVRRKLGDFASAVTTHHIDPGTPFGCTGHPVHSHSRLMADEISEVAILWPDAYDRTIRSFCTDKNNEVFQFLRQLKAFRLFSTSELGHIIGISERKRFRKGEIILEQNDSPKDLIILWKGSCHMFQDFTKPPLCGADGRDGSTSRADSGASRDGPAVLPYHHLLSTHQWPLGFHVTTQQKKKRKQIRGRRNALADRQTRRQNAEMMMLAMRAEDDASRDNAASFNESAPRLGNTFIATLGPGALFGESTFHDQEYSRSKCSVVAESLVEVVLFDHLRLQEMELAADIIREILLYAPEYLDEEQVLRQHMTEAAWNEYKNLRMLELSKTRWPDSKKHLRALSNGCSIMLDTGIATDDIEQRRTKLDRIVPPCPH